MGVRLLNKFLREKNPEGIEEKHLSFLRNRRIVVDINIYIYKFSVDNKLIENLFHMCSLFRKYDIHALFVFDGYKYNKNKEGTLKKRYEEKKAAKEQYENLIENYKDLTGNDYKENVFLNQTLRNLKSKFVKITKKDIEDVKELLNAYGMKYIVANGEADELCAGLVFKKKAYACLTEDTDLFVYGCPRILKYISLRKDTVLFYDVNKLIYNLSYNSNSFKEVAILSGTDYNETICNNIFENFKQLHIYLNETENLNYKISFLDWLIEKTIITQQDKDRINGVKKIFDIDSKKVFDNIPYIIIKNKEINQYNLMGILNENNFIFI
jgi:5'-3' exonuclease